MKHSVIMPVYLREESHRKVVEDTIKSIKQASGDYEFIIVDDGSTLDTKFLKKAADKYIRQKNQGISVAWNTGKNAAKGEYVVIVNDDVKVPLGWLDKLATGFREENTGVSAPFLGNPSVTPFINIEEDLIKKERFYPGYCFMLRKDRFFEDFDPQFTTNCGDTDYWHRVLMAGFQLVRVRMGIWHKEGDVLHKLDYSRVTEDSIEKFKAKHGFDPQTRYYR